MWRQNSHCYKLLNCIIFTAAVSEFQHPASFAWHPLETWKCIDTYKLDRWSAFANANRMRFVYQIELLLHNCIGTRFKLDRFCLQMFWVLIYSLYDWSKTHNRFREQNLKLLTNRLAITQLYNDITVYMHGHMIHLKIYSRFQFLNGVIRHSPAIARSASRTGER